MSLREYLALCPYEYQYETTNIKAMRNGLRRRLFAEATCNNKYIEYLFSDPADVLSTKPTEWLGKVHRSHDGRPCVRRLRQGEAAWRCLTCSLDDTCVLCSYCYNPEEHIGHNTYMRITHRDDGGICDCGDNEAWKVVLTCAASNPNADEGTAPQELIDGLESTVATAFDYVLDVMAAMHCGVQFMERPSDIIKNVNESQLDPKVYGRDIPGDGRYVLSLWNEERRSFQDATLAINEAIHKNEAFGFMVAKKVDAYGKGIVHISNNLDRLLEIKRSIKLFTTTIRSVRDYMREEMVDEIIHWLLDLSWATLRVGPGSLLRNIVGKALVDPWRCGNAHLNNGLSMSMDMLSLPSQLWHHSSLDGVRIPNIEDRIHEPDFFSVPPPHSQPEAADLLDFDSSGMSFSALANERFWSSNDGDDISGDKGLTHRFKYLIFFDIRFWKSLRSTLQDLYVSTLISNRFLKSVFGREYASLYPQIAELYVMLDREPERSCIESLSTQLFTTPSISTELLSGPYLSKHVAAIYSLLTLHKIGPRSCISQDMKVDPDSPILRNRRFGQLFHETTFLLSRNKNKAGVAANPTTLLRVADFMSLLQGISPVKRQTDKHIEFENDGWVFIFTSIPFFLQLGQGVALSAFSCNFEQTKGAINQVAQLLHRWAVQYMLRTQNNEIGMVQCASSFAGLHFEGVVSNFDPSEGVVSFHHPVHSFLSFLLQNCHVPDAASLKELLFDRNEELKSLGYNEEFLRSLLFEHPIQSVVVLSQIRVGLWVRNGYTMRNQLHHYREHTLRELAYAQDLFMIQCALVTLNPNLAFIQLVRRWNLENWSASTLYDENQRFYILEEFLHTLNILLTDRIYLQDKSKDEINREYFKREVIQTLAFMDMPFSDLGRYVPEHMLGDDEFEMVLRQCCTFTSPKGAKDVGMYSLKPELLDEFNPHYTHYTSARIEEAESAIAKKLSERHGCSPEEVVHIPPLTSVSGPWADLGAFTRSVAFASFMTHLFKTLLSMVNQKNQADIETVLNSAVYLLLMAVKNETIRDRSKSVQDNGVFDSLSDWINAEQNGTTFIQLLQDILRHSDFSAIHVRVQKLLELLNASSVQSDSSHHVAQSDNSARKQLGKQAKEKIMEQMRQQQLQFQQQQNQQEDRMDDDEFAEDLDEESSGWQFAKSNCVLCHMPDNKDQLFGQMTYTPEVSIVRTYHDRWADNYAGPSSLDYEESVEKAGEAGKSDWWQRYYDDDNPDIALGKAYPDEKIRKSTTIISGCGHNVHYSCYREYIAFQLSRSDHLMRLTAEDSSKKEYLCPLCRALNNSFVPIIWNANDSTASDILSTYGPNEVSIMENIQPSEHIANNGSLRLLVDKHLNPKLKELMLQSDENIKEALLEQLTKVGDTSKIENIIPVYTDTIRCMEISLRGKANPSQFGGILLDQLTGKNLKNLRALAHYLEAVICLANQPFKLGDGPLDPFEVFIVCIYRVCPIYNLSAAIALRWGYVMCIAQVIHKLRTNPDWELPNFGELKDADTAKALGSLVNADPEGVYSFIARHVTIFLRRCALAVHGLAGAYDEDDFKFMQDQPEHARLCIYLNLPRIDEVIVNLVNPQSDDSRISKGLFGPSPENLVAPLEYPGQYEFVHLPFRLDCFFHARDLNDSFPHDPAICLFCGTVIPSQRAIIDPNEKGQCTKHMAECARHYGIFIFPRRNHLFLTIEKGRGTFIEAPYLDIHGEPDESMRRGRAHYLHPVRLDNITRKLWLESEMFDLIARKIDQIVDFGGWDTI